MLDDILEKITGSASDLDPRKIVDLVDDLWDSRKKIVDAVDFVWDNRDEIMRAVDFVRDHADELLDLAKRLPDLLADAGGALATAGGGAHQASAMLLGDGGDGVRELADDAASALERAQRELADVMKMFAKLDDVPFMDPIVSGGAKIGSVADDLETVAGRLRGLGTAITSAGENLDDVGSMLESSGSTLQGFAAAPPKKTKAKRSSKKATTKKKPPAKKKTPAKKKPAARKASAKKKPAKQVAAKNSAAKKPATKKAASPKKKRTLPTKPKR